jgi:tRNA A-37 threonylcarbamoyl transferase component Bud32
MNGPRRHTTGAAEADLSGRQLGDFRLLRRLGRGAMADVYLAEQCSLRRQVAFKALKSHLATDPTYVARFQREARAAAALVHANIVQIHEVGCIEGVHFIAQEYVQGQNLRDWLHRNGPPDAALAIDIMRQVAAALAKAADQGIVHRDIKPENIMLTRSGEVKVADFGLARLPDAGEGVDLTQIGITLGTPLYMSPEQVEGKPLDPRSDIYSLGITCYQMLSGTPPFVGGTVLGVAVQHLKKRPKLLDNLCPHLPPPLCRIVHKMLAKEPERRYQSARELLADLRALQSELPGGQPWPDDAPPSPRESTIDDPYAETTQQLAALMNPPADGRRRRKWIVPGVGVVLAILLGGALAVVATRKPSPLAEVVAKPTYIPQQENVLRQWYYAAELGTEDAWWSVIEYFPEKEYMVFRAKQQLTRIYLREGKYDQAMGIFEEFAFLGEPDGEMRAFGLAGRCGVLTLQGKYRESAVVLAQLWPIRRQLKDPQMRQLLSHVVKKNRSELGAQTSREWQQWLAEQFREDS